MKKLTRITLIFFVLIVVEWGAVDFVPQMNINLWFLAFVLSAMSGFVIRLPVLLAEG